MIFTCLAEALPKNFSRVVFYCQYKIHLVTTKDYLLFGIPFVFYEYFIYLNVHLLCVKRKEEGKKSEGKEEKMKVKEEEMEGK